MFTKWESRCCECEENVLGLAMKMFKRPNPNMSTPNPNKPPSAALLMDIDNLEERLKKNYRLQGGMRLCGGLVGNFSDLEA